jgi:hypothetical protein
MKRHTIIFTKEDLRALKVDYDFLFQSEGVLSEKKLSYNVGISKLYFEPTIVFKQQDKTKEKSFQAQSKYADVHVVFCYEKGLKEYGNLLELKSKTETVPVSIQQQLGNSNYRTDFVVKMPDGLSWKFEYLNIGACGRMTDRSCQSCDSGCMSSFEKDLSQQNLDLNYICQHLEAYFNKDWMKK